MNEPAETVDRLPSVCILAGGLGTRLGAAARGLPKSLVPIAGQPFIFHQLQLLAEQGAVHIVLCVGFKGDLIENAVGRRRFGLEIDYSYDGPDPIGTLCALRRALPLMDGTFLYLYGDTYLRIDYRSVTSAWTASGLPALMTVLRNDGRWGTSNADFKDGLVVRYDKAQPDATMQWIDYGLGGLTKTALEGADPSWQDLADLHRMLAAQGLLFGAEANQRFYEIGSPAALRETERFLSRRHNP